MAELISAMIGGSVIQSREWWETQPSQIQQFPDGDLVCGDAFEMLQGLRDGVADVIFLDPPFNLGKRYGARERSADHLADEQYLDFMSQVLDRCCQILKSGGALYLYHLPNWAVRFASLLQEKLSFRHWIAISMKNGFARGNRLYPAHYALLYFTQGNPAVFSRPKIAPLTCPHCKQYVKDYGGYKRYIRDGINLSDVWDDLSPVRHNTRKHRAANELAFEIPRRAIAISGRPGGLLIDPFAGAGTSLIAAREADMQFIGCDREPQHFSLIGDRLRH